MEDTPLEVQDVTRLVAPPAIAMIVVASLSLLFNLVEIVFHPLGELLEELFRDSHLSHRESALATAVSVFSTLVSLAVAGTVLLGSLQMLRERSWALPLTAAILMVVPCLGPCCPIGIPVGVWALIVLLKPEVRRALEASD